MSDDFYRAFEAKFRGSRDLIKERLQIYVPFLMPLQDLYPNGETLDLGCGRGEWLELMGEFGFHAVGVDLNQAMLDSCVELCLRGKH
jgi:O-antigen chain-terminating methyltransferase